jgi:LDH2 family malate/lactate/ureidoglycolate dehydrogenase
MPEGLIVMATALEEFCRNTFLKAGMDPEGAAIVAESLVEADLRGVNTHGVVRIWLYEKRMRAGLIRPSPTMRLERTGPGTAILHGGNGAGQVVGRRAMQEAIALAKEAGVGCVAAHESHHFGTAAWFAMQALPHDMIGFAVTHADTGVAPFGAARGFLGTNPFCVAIPAGEEEPIVLDMATSVVAMGKVLAAKAAGKSIPLGWAIDSAGRPTTDPAKAWDGALLPLGGPKGFGIGLVLEVLSALLVGSPFGPHIPRPFELKTVQNLGHFFAALDIGRFLPSVDFKARLDQMIREIKGLPLAPGCEEILMPGEPEARCRKARLRDGIPLTAEAAQGLREYGFTGGMAC